MADPGDPLSLPKPQPAEDTDQYRVLAEFFHKMSKGTQAKSEELEGLQKHMVDFLVATGGMPGTTVKEEEAEGASSSVVSTKSTHQARGNVVTDSVASSDSGVNTSSAGTSSSSNMDTRFYKLPNFSGEGGKGDVSFELWKFEVQCLIDAGKHLDLIGQSIRRSLRGAAANVMMTLGPQATPTQIITKLRSLYGVVDDQETLLENFYAAHQLEDENVTDWACRLEGLLTRADSSLLLEERNRRLHNKFWSGLKQDLREVSGHKADAIDNYEELCIAVRSIERAREKTVVNSNSKTKAAIAKSTTPYGEGDELKATLNQLTAAVKNLERRFSDRSKNEGNRGTSRQYRGGYRGSGSRGRGRGFGSSQPRADIICWRCHQPGHIKARCDTVLPEDLNSRTSTEKDQQ